MRMAPPVSQVNKEAPSTAIGMLLAFILTLCVTGGDTYGLWSPFSSCSVTCGQGTKSRTCLLVSHGYPHCAFDCNQEPCCCEGSIPGTGACTVCPNGGSWNVSQCACASAWSGTCCQNCRYTSRVSIVYAIFIRGYCVDNKLCNSCDVSHWNYKPTLKTMYVVITEHKADLRPICSF